MITRENIAELNKDLAKLDIDYLEAQAVVDNIAARKRHAYAAIKQLQFACINEELGFPKLFLNCELLVTEALRSDLVERGWHRTTTIWKVGTEMRLQDLSDYKDTITFSVVEWLAMGRCGIGTGNVSPEIVHEMRGAWLRSFA